MYFLKHDLDRLKINVASSEITVDTRMRVLGVMFDSSLSWENHILFSIVNKKMHALKKISSHLSQAELVNEYCTRINFFCTLLCGRHLAQ